MARFRKAVAAVLTAGLVPPVIALVGVYAPGLDLGLITTLVLSILGMVAGGYAVYETPNAGADPRVL